MMTLSIRGEMLVGRNGEDSSCWIYPCYLVYLISLKWSIIAHIQISLLQHFMFTSIPSELVVLNSADLELLEIFTLTASMV
jgi:hypothetical protein